ncbi:MAG: M23 family metallopeptidase [Proteobacteria bacterium]|nr:M23 family metallopeptidase [Pseudomonadota bacterium]
MISNQETEQFWRALGVWCERVEVRLIQMRDWQSLGRLQVISQVWAQAASCDTNTLAKVAEIAPMLAEFIFLELDDETPKLSHFAQRALEIFKSADRDASKVRHEALARRLYAMHQFLDGVSASDHFGTLRTSSNADIHYGLGVSLHDGSLLKLFTTLSEKTGQDLEPLLVRTFEDEAPQLLDAIHGGQTSFEQFMQSQLILRYDPALSRKVYDVSEVMQSRFGRFGAEPEVRSAQIDLVAGDRFRTAHEQAQKTGIRSMRGFAMLFDMPKETSGDIGSALDNAPGESQKCLSLADAVISRMHGHVASHWQTRLQSIFHGVGNIDGRRYEEKRFFGQNVAQKTWTDMDFPLEDEQLCVEPRAGKIYVVCPGDRLSELMHRAYAGQGDYRQVLRQNPHIQMPEALTPGMRIYFPTDCDDGLKPKMPEIQPEDAQISEDGATLTYGGRTLTHLWPMTETQKADLCQNLNRLKPSQLYHTVAVELPEGGAIICHQVTLLMSDACHAREWQKKDAMRMAREAQHSSADTAYLAAGQIAGTKAQEIQENAQSLGVMGWLRRLAAEMRGDIVFQDKFLPLASIVSQPHRQAWMATALKRVMADGSAQPFKLMIHAKTRSVDVMDAYGSHVLRLENEDFGAIRMQPERRLSDYVAPPIVQMNALSQLWLADLMGISAEIAVPPVSHANQYPAQCPNGEARFLVPMGTPVYPMMRGVIVDCGMFPGFGQGVLVRHHDGLYVRYSSLATVSVSRGQKVTPETMLARSGSLYVEPEPMLCVEIRRSDKPVTDWFGFGGKPAEYFDVVCNLWPHQGPFDVLMGD